MIFFFGETRNTNATSLFFSQPQLPLSLLRTAQRRPMLVELKNGDTYNGHLVNCDNWMNINLRDVICTSRVSLSSLVSCLTFIHHAFFFQTGWRSILENCILLYPR